MKTKILSLTLLLPVIFNGLSVHAQAVNDLKGKWNCEAPAAPAEYNTGIMEITDDVVYATFSGDPYRYASTIEKFTNDSLVFTIKDLDAICTLVMESKVKMTGKAVWPDGESPLILTKTEKEESSDSEQK